MRGRFSIRVEYPEGPSEIQRDALNLVHRLVEWEIHAADSDPSAAMVEKYGRDRYEEELNDISYALEAAAE